MSLHLTESKQIYVYSKFASTVYNATNRNRISVNLIEPINVPSTCYASVSIVSAEIPITGSMGNHMYLLVGSSLKSYNNSTFNGINTQGAFIAKIPVQVPGGYIANYYNFNNYSCKISDSTIKQFAVSLVAEDGTDLVIGSDWSITFQFDIHHR